MPKSHESFRSRLASAKPSPQPIPKILYSEGHVITEGFDLTYFQYQLYNDRESSKKYLSFNVDYTPYMILHQSATDGLKDGIAMEVHPVGPGYKPDSELCKQKSEKLRSLIESCYANIALRELTASEKEQLQKLKDEKKGTRSYQLVYKQKNINAQFSGIDYFQLSDKKIDGTNGFNVNINSLTDNKSEMKLVGDLDAKSFVIENQPAGSQKDCKETDLDLKPKSCYGDIQIRKLNSDH